MVLYIHSHKQNVLHVALERDSSTGIFTILVLTGVVGNGGWDGMGWDGGGLFNPILAMSRC